MLGAIKLGLSRFDSETRVLLVRVIIRASRAPDSNAWLKERLRAILEQDGDPQPAVTREQAEQWLGNMFGKS